MTPVGPSQFEQQDAAIAMASMQNGIIPPLDYNQQMQMGMGGEMLSAEQTLNMSPMDLFDSIFWEHIPLAWNKWALTTVNNNNHCTKHFSSRLR